MHVIRVLIVFVLKILSAHAQLSSVTIWTSTRENLSLVFANNKGADQPAQTGSLATFVIHLFESIVYNPATNEISIFQLVSIAEGTGLRLALRKPRGPIMYYLLYLKFQIIYLNLFKGKRSGLVVECLT